MSITNRLHIRTTHLGAIQNILNRSIIVNRRARTKLRRSQRTSMRFTPMRIFRVHTHQPNLIRRTTRHISKKNMKHTTITRFFSITNNTNRVIFSRRQLIFHFVGHRTGAASTQHISMTLRAQHGGLITGLRHRHPERGTFSTGNRRFFINRFFCTHLVRALSIGRRIFESVCQVIGKTHRYTPLQHQTVALTPSPRDSIHASIRIMVSKRHTLFLYRKISYCHTRVLRTPCVYTTAAMNQRITRASFPDTFTR